MCARTPGGWSCCSETRRPPTRTRRELSTAPGEATRLCGVTHVCSEATLLSTPLGRMSFWPAVYRASLGFSAWQGCPADLSSINSCVPCILHCILQFCVMGMLEDTQHTTLLSTSITVYTTFLLSGFLFSFYKVVRLLFIHQNPDQRVFPFNSFL